MKIRDIRILPQVCNPVSANSGRYERDVEMMFRRLALKTIRRDTGMRNLIRPLVKGMKAISHIAFTSFILVMPIGYYPDNPDSTSLAIGVHGGVGQIASVLRGCDGEALHSESSSYDDASLSANFAIPSSGNSSYVLGLKVGRWTAPNAGFATRNSPGGGYGRSAERRISFSYVNPSISIETENRGFGLGYIFGDVPSSFSDYKYSSGSKVRFSGHFRLGNLNEGYFAMSLAENSPLVSGGGLFDIGGGYSFGRRVRMFSGVSFMFYNQPGLLQQGKIRINRNLDVDLAFRLGQAGGTPETSASFGLVFKLGGAGRNGR